MLVAQLDRVSDYGSEGWEFESFQARFLLKKKQIISLKSIKLKLSSLFNLIGRVSVL